MKKYTLLTILSAVALLASCNRVEPQPQPQFNGNGLILALDSGSMTTKADDEAPALPAFETKIDHFDFFFFDDEAGTTPTDGMHARISGASTQLNTGIGQTYEALRLGTHYVYILANYPGTIDHSDNWKLADLLALEFESELASFDDEGAATFCDYLVMDSYNETTGKYTQKVTPATVQEEGEVKVGLSRIAAKLTLTINVKDKVRGTMGDNWTPILKDIQAYYVNALNNKSTVDATPVRRANLESTSGQEYVTYPTNYKLTSTGDYSFVLADVYTYPQTWKGEDNGEPYFKVFLPWLSDKRGTSNFYYKVTVPKPDEGSTWVISRNSWYNVTVELSVVDSIDDYVEVTGTYSIHPWGGSATPGGPPLNAARFFEVPTRTFQMYSSESLSIPFSSSSTVEAFFTDINYYYYGDKDTKHYDFTFQESDKRASVTLPTTYNGATIPVAGRDTNPYSVTVEGKSVVFSHSLSGLFTNRSITLVIQQKDNPSNRAVITILQHPAIEMIKHSTNSMFVNGYFGHVALPVDGDGQPFARHNGYTWQYAASNPDQPSTFYHSTKNTTGTTLNQNGTFNFTDGQYGWGSVYGNTGFDSSISQTPFMTEVVVSAFNTTNDTYEIRYGSETAEAETKTYRIGDPRKTAESQGYSATWLNNYLYSETYTYNTNGTVASTTEVTRAWQEPLQVLVASQQASEREVIAPRFLISSALNVTGGVRWYGAVRRAATYQEAGYPAGRWRLPTEAEIAFIMARQQEGSLPTLFANTSIYWSADGRALKGQKGHPIISYVTGTNDDGTSVSLDRPLRFVYDLWYWGDEPADPNQYHPNGHIINY